MKGVLDFIVQDVFGNAAIFIAIIAAIGLILQKKKFSEVLSGGFKTAIGTVALTSGVSILITAILGLSDAFVALKPQTVNAAGELGASAFSAQFGAEIGIVMLLSFAINILVARFTKFKTIFLTGHMLYWFPFVFLAAGYDAGLTGAPLIILATIVTALYMVVSPNILQPYVRAVTGTNDFAVGHPTTILSLIAGTIAKYVGNKEKSTESLNLPKGLSFLKEIGISSAIVIALTYYVFAILLVVNGKSPVEIFGLRAGVSMATFGLIKGFTFGTGITIMMLGVRMMIAEIVPAFKGFSDKFVPDAIPALDCAILFPFAPNAMIIGFITSMITSIITIIIVSSMGVFPTVILPLTVTCLFEIGTAGVISNAQGGIRGTIIGTAVAGIVMVLLIGFGAPFFLKTINSWLLVYGGQDFSFWGILEGLVARGLVALGL
jgi:PTS system ascorbate-specific IIC component